MKAPRLVMVDPYTVHDLNTNTHCDDMINLRKEFSQGRECYTPVRPIQALVYKIPGCTQCFGGLAAFEHLIRTS